MNCGPEKLNLYMDYLIFGKNSNIIFFTTCAFLYCIADNVGFLKEKIYWYNVPKESENNFLRKKCKLQFYKIQKSIEHVYP